MSRQTRKIHYDFRGELALALAGSGVGNPFVKADTSAAGSPTVGGLTGGGIRMAFSETNEVQNLCVFMGDVLPFNIAEIVNFEIVVKTVASLDATSSIAFGLCSARNDAISSLAAHASFRCVGNNNVIAETKDSVTSLSNIPTGLTLKDRWKRFRMDFASRNTTIEPPSLSRGRRSNIEFYGANDNGALRRVASGTRFDMSAYSGGLQIYAQLQKTQSTNVNSFDILEANIEVSLPV